MRLPLDRLLFLPNVPAGMDALVVAAIACSLRKTLADVDPIVVRDAGATLDATADPEPTWRVLDGRHRVIASYLAGRTDIPAVIEEAA